MYKKKFNKFLFSDEFPSEFCTIVLYCHVCCSIEMRYHLTLPETRVFLRLGQSRGLVTHNIRPFATVCGSFPYRFFFSVTTVYVTNEKTLIGQCEMITLSVLDRSQTMPDCFNSVGGVCVVSIQRLLYKIRRHQTIFIKKCVIFNL